MSFQFTMSSHLESRASRKVSSNSPTKPINAYYYHIEHLLLRLEVHDAKKDNAAFPYNGI